MEVDANGASRHLAYGPYLDYRPLASDELELETLLTRPELGWMDVNLEQVHAELMAALDGIAAGIGHCDCVEVHELGRRSRFWMQCRGRPIPL